MSRNLTSWERETDAVLWYSTNSFRLLNLTTQRKNFPCASRNTLKCCTPSEHLRVKTLHVNKSYPTCNIHLVWTWLSWGSNPLWVLNKNSTWTMPETTWLFITCSSDVQSFPIKMVNEKGNAGLHFYSIHSNYRWYPYNHLFFILLWI